MIPQGSGQGSYSPHGFYLPERAPGLTAIPLAEGTRYKSGDWEVKANENAVLFTDETSPCGNGFTVAMPVGTIRIEGRRATLTSDLVMGEIAGEEKTDAKGRKFFCGTLEASVR